MRLLIGVLCVLSLVGCIKKGNKNDPDGKKAKAQVVQVDTQVKDSLKGADGDFEDWKAIEVKEPGRLRVMVLMGNIDCQCSVEMLDPEGNEIASYNNFKKEPRLDVPVDKAKPGYYLVRLRAKKEFDYSAYLLETVFRAAPKPIKDNEPEPEPKVVEPAVVEAKPINAKITKSKPGRAGYLVLTLDKGSKDGLSEGLIGAIDGLEKGELKIIKVLDGTSEAETALDAKSIKGKNNVTIQPKK
jgi:hypothetical protein